MPLKIAEKKLLIPIISILIALCILAIIPIFMHDAPLFVPLGRDCRRCLPLGNGFAAVSYSGIDVYSPKGELILNEKLSLSPDMCAAGGGMLAAVSGQTVRLFSSEGYLGEINGEGEILSLDATENFILVTRQSADYSCRVSVYDRLSAVFDRFIAAGVCTFAAEADGTLFLALDCGETSQLLLLDTRGGEIDRLDFASKVTSIQTVGNSVCVGFDDLLCFVGADGEKCGEYSGKFSSVRAFDGVLCALVPNGAISLDEQGKLTGKVDTPANIPRFLGEGKYPALILGKEVTVFSKKMQYKYTIENNYVPANVITYKNAAVLTWSRAAEIHRK